MKKLDKSLNFTSLIIMLLVALLAIIVVGVVIWSNTHRAIDVSISDDNQITQISSQSPININVEYAGYIVICVILILVIIFYLIQSLQKKEIVMELRKLSEEISSADDTVIETQYSYIEFVNIIDAYNEKILQIDEQVKRKDEYFNMTVHDLRIPLQAVKNNVTLLEKFPTDSEIYNELKAEIIHLEDEISRYLLLEKIEYFELVKLEKVEINQYISQLVKKFSNNSNYLSVTYGNEKYVDIDRLMFEKVIMNLVQNGIQYSSDHQIKIVVNDDCLEFINKVDSQPKPIFKQGRSQECHGNGIGSQIILKYLHLQNLSLVENYANNYERITINY